MMIKRKLAACAAAVLTLPLAGCGVMASNGLDYSSYPIPTLPAATAVEPAPPAAAPCQMPESGQPISLAGCRTGDTVVLHGVTFEFNQSALTLNAKVLLDQVAEALVTRPDIKVEIDGHTDGKGTDVYNQKLPEHRAEAVKAYLTHHGIAADRLTAKGFGKSMPVADNTSDAGREKNRRVELKVLEAAAPAAAITTAPSLAASAAAKNSAIVVLEPLPVFLNEPGSGIPTSIGVLTHVPNPTEAGPTPDYKNRVPMTQAEPAPGPAWKNPSGGAGDTPPPAVTPTASAVTRPSPVTQSAAATSHATMTANGTTVAISNFSFLPETLIVSTGTTVTWTNRDQVTHTVKFPDQDHTIANGESFSRTFDKAGEYIYQCGIHASMKGKIIAR